MSLRTVFFVFGLGVSFVACSPCDGTSFRIIDSTERVPVPSVTPQVHLVLPDITTSGGTAQRATSITILQGDTELARQEDVYEGQAVRFSVAGARWRVEVTKYWEHLVHDDEADLCVVRE